MAHWRETITAVASFNGVPFFIDSAESSSGRDIAEHGFPFSEDPHFQEDMGRSSRAFNVEGYVLGADYLDKRRALFEELQKPGPGELIHPFNGSLQVVVARVRVRDSLTDGGFAQFSIEFRETLSNPKNPVQRADERGSLLSTAEDTRGAIEAEFLVAYDDASALRDSVVESLRKAALTVNKIADRVTMESQATAAIAQSANTLKESGASLAGAASTLFSTMLGLIDSLSEGLLSAINPAAELARLYSFVPGTRPPDTTPARATERANFDATQRLLQRLVLVKAAELAVDQTYVAYDDAVSIRNTLIAMLDAQMKLAGADTFSLFQQLRADIVAAIPGSSSDLPRLKRHTPTNTVPSLVLAHRLYGNLNREADLVARNKLRHAGFVPGGVELEILTDD